MLTIDFEDTKNPVVKKLDIDFEKTGLALCIIDSGADHADLTDEYAAIPLELEKKSAPLSEKEVLREIPEQEFMAAIPRIRKRSGRQSASARHPFLRGQRESAQTGGGSGEGRHRYLPETGEGVRIQLLDVSAEHCSLRQQGTSGDGPGLALCDKLLKGRGAYRVHGGGLRERYRRLCRWICWRSSEPAWRRPWEAEAAMCFPSVR